MSIDNVEKLNQVLLSFKIAATCQKFLEYKNACFYDIELKPGTRVKDLEKYSTEFSLALKAYSKPRINVLPENGIIRFEFLKSKSDKISLLDLAKNTVRPQGDLTCLMGETLEGKPLWIDVAKNPHMLVAGSTGSGKSTVLHTIIANALLYPKIKIYLMDPKNIEFFKYEEFESVNVDYTIEQCLSTLEKLNEEMDKRYLFIKNSKKDNKSLPFVILIIDEFADLKLQDIDNKFHKQLCRLAQKSRAARMHIVLATQRPSVNVLDGTIKANFPSRLSCKVASHIDAKVILDTSGAEDLIGAGDAIINNLEYNHQRFQSAYITPEEILKHFRN